MGDLLLPSAAVIAIAWLAWLRPHLSFYALLVALPTQFLFVPVSTFHTSPADVLVLGTGAALLGRALARNKDATRALRAHLWVGVMIAAYALGGLMAGVQSRTLARLALGAVPSVLALELLRGGPHLAAGTTALIMAGVLDTVLAVWIYATGDGLYPGRFSGVGGPNFSGMILAIAAAVALVRLARRRTVPALTLPATFALLTAATLSKMGILALIVGSAIVVPLISRRNRMVLAGAAAIVVVVALTQPGIRTTLWERTQPAEQNDGVARSSMELRWWMLVTAARAFRDHPLIGVGFGRFQQYSNTHPEIAGATAGRGFGTHNTYAEVLAEGGLLAFIPFVLHFSFLRRVTRDFAHAVRTADLATSAAIVALVLILLSAALTNLLLHYTFWAISGLGFAAIRLQASGDGAFPLIAEVPR